MVTMRVFAEVDASCDLLLRHLARNRIGVRENLQRKFVRDVVLADDHFDVHARIADEAEDLHDAAAGKVRGAVGITVDLHVDHLAVAGVARAVGLDQDVGVDSEIERHDVRLDFVRVKASHDGVVGAAQDLRHFTDDEVTAVELAEGRRLLVDAYYDQIAVHRSAHGAAVDVDVGLGVAAEDRAVAVGVNFDAAGVVRRELEQRIALSAHGEDHAVSLEILHGQGDLLAADRGVGEALVDVADVEQAIAAASQELDDALLELRFHWRSSVYAERSEASPVRTGRSCEAIEPRQRNGEDSGGPRNLDHRRATDDPSLRPG